MKPRVGAAALDPTNDSGSIPAIAQSGAMNRRR